MAIDAAELVDRAEHGTSPYERNVAEHRILVGGILSLTEIDTGSHRSLCGACRTRCVEGRQVVAGVRSKMNKQEMPQSGGETRRVRIYDARWHREPRRIRRGNVQIDDRAVQQLESLSRLRATA